MALRTRMKVCGITVQEDARAAVAAGADGLGFIFVAQSPRVVDPDMVRVVPLGVDQGIFRVDGPVSPLVPPDTFTFLFVGGAVQRKGIDLLIKAYQSVFTSADNVALVIKGDSSNLFYKGRSEGMNQWKSAHAVETKARTLAEALEGAR